MGTTATIFRFQVELSDIDRGVYESLDLRVAQHPSEETERMVVRVLARAVAHEAGLEFGRGISNQEDAGIWAHDMTGQVVTWIDLGIPSADRLHRASKLCSKVLVFTDKSETALLKEWRKRKIHKAETIQVHRLPADLVMELAHGMERRVNWYVTIQDQMLTVTVGDRILEGRLGQVSLGDLCSSASGV